MWEGIDPSRSRRFAPRLLAALAVVAGAILITMPGFRHAPSATGTASGLQAAGRPYVSASATEPRSKATSTQAVLTGATVAPDPQLHVVGNSLVNSAGSDVRLFGVDATGTEDACVQDRGFSRGPDTAAEAKEIAGWHANAVRVPLNEDCWLGINGAPPAYSGAGYRAAIEQWVSELNAAGMIAILDLHWSAPGSIEATHEWPMPDATHSVTFWTQVASAFKADPMVMFDLFNEPALGRWTPTASDWSCWRNGCVTTAQNCPTTLATRCTTVTYQVAGMQQLVDAVRNAGADQPLMIGGLSWAGTFCDGGSVSAGTCAWLNYEPTDPLHQIVLSFHNYFQKTKCATLACWNSTIAALAHRVPVVTGELGEKNCSATFVQQYMQWADLHGVSYLLWAWQPVTTTSCGPQKLINNWLGTPNPRNPVGSLVVRNFGAEKPPRL